MNILTHKHQATLAIMLLIITSLAYAAEDKRITTDSRVMRGYIDSRYMQLLDAYANPVVAEREATYLRNLYEALIKKGFSKDEALKIVIEHESPLTGTVR